MKAITQDRYGSADVLELHDVERPSVGDGDVLIRVEAAGVDAGVWHLMTGTPYLVRLSTGLRAPKTRVRGMDVAGRVEAVGAGVTRFKPGDEVFGVCGGAFADFALAKPDKLVLKPANLTAVQAAAVPTSAVTALRALRDAGAVQSGQRVLVIGAGGGVGSFAVQLAKVFGAEVTGVCSTSKVDLVKSLGADQVVDYTRQDLTGHYDLVLDIAGNRPLRTLRRLLTPRGTLVIVGGEGGGGWLGMGRQFRALVVSPFVRQRLRMMIAITGEKDLRFLGDLLEAGKLVPAVERTYPLSETPDAVRRWAAGQAHGKLVITV
jgi:NADPH:quinone reductase-like Zn-dependent oxidoreductase